MLSGSRATRAIPIMKEPMNWHKSKPAELVARNTVAQTGTIPAAVFQGAEITQLRGTFAAEFKD